MNRPANNCSPATGAATALIYVVDDEVVLLEMAAVVLKAAGYDVRTFRNAEAALAAFAEAGRRPELIITDYTMLDMTGLDLIAECRRVELRQKTILVSGTQAEQICEDAHSRPDRFLSKPYDARELINAVEALLPPAQGCP